MELELSNSEEVPTVSQSPGSGRFAALTGLLTAALLMATLSTAALLATACTEDGVRGVARAQGKAPAHAQKSVASSEQVAEAQAFKRTTGKLDVTFLVAADTHVGFGVSDDGPHDPLFDPSPIERTNLRMILSMNGVAGRKQPSVWGGTLAKPRGVLMPGDLTESGGESEWKAWTALYGLSGREGVLELPVFEGAGNHDRVTNWYVRQQVARRHGGRHYFFDWDDLRVVCLGEAPGSAALEVLEQAFTTAASDVPFILYFHYPLEGPFSDNWFTREGHRERFADVIRQRRILAIFHGHYHATGASRWRGVDVYNVGSPKHAYHSYAVVHVTSQRLRVAAWNYDSQRYTWWRETPL